MIKKLLIVSVLLITIGVVQNLNNDPLKGCVYKDSDPPFHQYVCKDSIRYKVDQ